MASCPLQPHITVVTVHGALVTGWEMALLRRRLRRAGYRVRPFHYRSRGRGLEENARLLRAFIQATPGETIHGVGHSMGGVLLRRVFEQNPDPRPGRLVAIGSPFLDCWVARKIDAFHPLGCWIIGRTTRDHITESSASPWRGARPLGVLAGTFPLGVGSLLAGLPRPHDGVVRWEETRLPGITDHATCGLNHFGMLFSDPCARQIIHFLETGAFTHLPPAA